MILTVQVDDFKSNDLMSLSSVTFEVVHRECPIQDDPNSFVLVKNGPLEMSYSPLCDHYYFSKLPDEEWFSNHYKSNWMSGVKNRVWDAAILRWLKPHLSRGRRLVQNVMNTRSLSQISTELNAKSYFALLRPYLNKNDQVFDIGCGTGDFLEPYKGKGIVLAGLEPSEKNSKIARKRGIKVLTGSLVNSIKIREVIKRSKVIFSNHSVEHHWDPNKLFSLCAEEMMEGTLLSVTVPNSNVDLLLLQNLFPLHIDNYTATSLEMMFNKHGFDVIHKEEGLQLRFVAVKRREIAPPLKVIDFNLNSFVESYQRKFMDQLFNVYKFDCNTEKNFEFVYEGAYPFTRWSYNILQQNAEDKIDARSIRGRVKFKDGNDTVVEIHTDSKKSSKIFLK